MKKAVLFLLFGVLFSSCSEVAAPVGDDLIYGGWVLIEKAGGEGYQRTVINYSNRTVFKKDGTVEFYKNDKLDSRTTFTIKKSEDDYMKDNYKISFGDGLWFYVLKLTRDEMTLSNGDLDGFSYYYVKEKFEGWKPIQP